MEQIERDFDRDNYMSAEEAKAYGIIDHVIERRGELVDVPSPAAHALASAESSWECGAAGQRGYGAAPVIPMLGSDTEGV